MIKRSFSLILRYASFLSVAIASIMMLVRYRVVHQIYGVQYIFFLHDPADTKKQYRNRSPADLCLCPVHHLLRFHFLSCQ